MKALFLIGSMVVILGLISLAVPIPRTEREGFKAGGFSIGLETQHSERLSPVVGGVMIPAGAGMMIAGKGRS